MNYSSNTIIGYENGFVKLQTEDGRQFELPQEFAPHGIGNKIVIETKTPQEQRINELEIKKLLLAELIS